ncbi:hypothetical protein D3C80_1944180 [compost metagenome]
MALHETACSTKADMLSNVASQDDCARTSSTACSQLLLDRVIASAASQAFPKFSTPSARNTPGTLP